MKKLNKTILALSTVTAISILSGCGGGSGETSQTVTGVLADGAIGNARYECGGTTGFTNRAGEFTCPVGSSVEFFFGNIKLGGVAELPSDKIVLIQDVLDVQRSDVENEKVAKLAIFLQSLDEDSDHDNGIFLDPNDIASIQSEIEFDSLDDTNIDTLIQSAGKTKVKKEVAIKNLRETTDNVRIYENISGNSSLTPSTPTNSSPSTPSTPTPNNPSPSTPNNPSPSVTCGYSLNGAYYNGSLVSDSNPIGVGVDSNITLSFSKDINTSGLNIAATNNNITLSGIEKSADNNISLNYLVSNNIMSGRTSDLNQTDSLTITQGVCNIQTNINLFSKYTILDLSFANVGYLTSVGAAGGNSDAAFDMIIDSNENVFATGYAYGTSTGADIAIWKYNSSGTLDTSFGTNGIVTHNGAAGGSAADQANAITLDNSGNVYITGKSYDGSRENMAIWKYDSSGSLDTSFGGGDGIATYVNTLHAQSKDEGEAIIVDGSGNVYVAGDGYDGSSHDMILLKYTSTGVLDTSFGTNGVIRHDDAGGKGGNNHDYGQAIKIDNSGNIYIAGSSSGNGTSADTTLWKYDSSGSLDTSFGGGDGIVTHHNAAGGNNDDRARTMTLDSNGNIYLAGYSVNSTWGYDLAVWKFDSSGNLDTTFSGDGVVTYSGGHNQDEAKGISIDSNGNIFVTGYSKNSDGVLDMLVLKYDSSGNLDTNYATNGAFTHNPDSSSNAEGYSIKLNSSNEPYIGGRSGYGMAIWKLK